MKKIFSFIYIVLIMCCILGLLTGCSKKEENKNTVEKKQVQEDVKSYSWPDLTNYGIPNFEKGKITDLSQNESQDDHLFYYDVELKSITKDDITSYCEDFEDDWQLNDKDSDIYLTKVDDSNTYIVTISFNEEDETAKIVMSAN